MRQSRSDAAVVQTSHLARYRFIREIAIVALGYFVYSQVRGISADRTLDALGNAYSIIDLEEKLGIFKELAVQAFVLPHGPLVQLFNFIYFYGFFPLLVPTAVWLFVKRPKSYELLRNAFLISGGIAVLFFLVLPTAPPRLLGMGFVDTLNQSVAPSYSSIPGVNHFAAVPSMHVGWTLLTTLGLYLVLQRNPLRYAVWALPVIMMTSTVVTGNHYFLDGLLGVVVALAGLLIALALDSGVRAAGRRLKPATDRSALPE